MNIELAQAWGDFLGRFAWDWFLTLTFAEPVRSFPAHRKFDRFAKEIEAAVEVPIAWFRGDDHGRLSGRFHIHALMMHVGKLNPFSWMACWEKRAGYARILPYDPSLGATYYIAKHVANPFSEWEFSDDLDAFVSTTNSSDLNTADCSRINQNTSRLRQPQFTSK